MYHVFGIETGVRLTPPEDRNVQYSHRFLFEFTLESTARLDQIRADPLDPRHPRAILLDTGLFIRPVRYPLRRSPRHALPSCTLRGPASPYLRLRNAPERRQ